MLLHQTLGGALCSVECRQIPCVGTHLCVSCVASPRLWKGEAWKVRLSVSRGTWNLWFLWRCLLVSIPSANAQSISSPPCHLLSPSVPSPNRVWPSQQIEGLRLPLSLALPSPLRRRGSEYYLCWLSPSLTASTRLVPFRDAPYLFLITCETQIELCSSSEEVLYTLD